MKNIQEHLVLFKKAQKHYDLHDYETALKIVRHSLEANNSFSWSFLLLARIYLQLHDYKKSLKSAQTALSFHKRKETIIPFYQLISEIYFAQNNINASIDSLLQALEFKQFVHEKTIYKIYKNISNLYLEKEDFDGSLKYLIYSLIYYNDNHNDLYKIGELLNSNYEQQSGSFIKLNRYIPLKLLNKYVKTTEYSISSQICDEHLLNPSRYQPGFNNTNVQIIADKHYALNINDLNKIKTESVVYSNNPDLLLITTNSSNTLLNKREKKIYNKYSTGCFTTNIFKLEKEFQNSSNCFIPGTTLVLSCHWTNVPNYCHLLLDTIPRVELALEKVALEQIDNIVYNKFHSSSFIQAVFESFGFNFQKINIIDSHIDNNRILSFENLIMPSILSHPMNLNSQLLQKCKNRFIKKQVDSFRFVYISRSDAKYRKITNESELESILDFYGFEKISLNNMDFKDQIKIFSESSIVIGAHGANLTNIMFCSPNTYVIEILNDSYGTDTYMNLAILNKLKYFYLSAISDYQKPHEMNNVFRPNSSNSQNDISLTKENLNQLQSTLNKITHLL